MLFFFKSKFDHFCQSLPVSRVKKHSWAVNGRRLHEELRRLSYSWLSWYASTEIFAFKNVDLWRIFVSYIYLFALFKTLCEISSNLPLFCLYYTNQQQRGQRGRRCANLSPPSFMPRLFPRLVHARAWV